MISKHKEDQLEAEDEMTALMQRFEAYGSMHFIKVDDNNRLMHTLIIPNAVPKILIQAWTTPVVQMDCTYRTDKYGIQMLYLVASTNLNKIYILAYRFMGSTLEIDYKYM